MFINGTTILNKLKKSNQEPPHMELTQMSTDRSEENQIVTIKIKQVSGDQKNIDLL